MASTTAAGKLWRLLLADDDFASSLMLAVRDDSTDEAQRALDIVDLGLNAFNLTDQELDSFLRGVTTTGVLEVTSWGGYYVTDPLPNGNKYALLIASLDNTVYWGPESKLIDNFKQFATPYKLPDDGTLRFSTDLGDAELRFDRTYDMEEDTVSMNSLKGTIGGCAIAGAQTVPPWPEDAATPEATAQEQAKPQGVTPWYQEEGMQSILAYAGLLGGTVAGVQLILWMLQLLKSLSRDKSVKRLTDVLTQDEARALAMARATVGALDVDWNAAGNESTNKVEQKLNEVLRNVDYNTADPEKVIIELRPTTRDALLTAFNEYATNHILDSIFEQSDRFKAYPDYTRWAADYASSLGVERASQKFASFGYERNPSAFDDLTREVVYQARSLHFANSYDEAARRLPAADKAAADATAQRVSLEENIRRMDQELEDQEKAGEASPLLMERRDELDRELGEQERIETEKQRQADELRRESESGKEGKARSDEEHDKAESSWKDTMREHGL